VQRIRINQNGVETKVWKKYQFVEALRDPKTWMFFAFGAVADLVGGVGVEYAAVIKALGFTTAQSTVLNVPSGFMMIISITLGTLAIRRWPNSRCALGIIGFLPGILACILLLVLPMKDKMGLVVQIWIMNLDGLGFVMILSLCTVVVAGHTKKMTVNAIFFIGYALGQMLSPQFWKIQYRPRNSVPWIILMCSYFGDIVIISGMWYYLSTENKRRDAEKLASGKEYDEFGVIEMTEQDGTVKKVKVPIQFLDLTDMENKAFRYAT